MKSYSRAYNRWKADCKLEKRIRIWAPLNQSICFINKDKHIYELSGEELRNKIRSGEYWKFLRHTSTPCSCGGCAYLKYKREPKNKINKKIWNDIQDNL